MMVLRNRILLLVLVVLGAFSVCQGDTVELVSHNAARSLAPGQMLEVTYRGPSGQLPSFRLDGIMHGGLLEESSPGVYRGELLITPSMGGHTARLVVSVEAQEIAASEPVTLESSAAHKVVIEPSFPPRAAFDEMIQADTVRMWVNGREIEQVRLESNYFVPAEPLDPTPGPHVVRVEAVTIDGDVLARQAELDVAAR